MLTVRDLAILYFLNQGLVKKYERALPVRARGLAL